LQGCLDLIDQLSLLLPLPLSIHVHASLLDHRQTLHPEHVVLQQRLFGLQPR